MSEADTADATCDEPAIVALIVGGGLFSAPCIDHAPQLGAYIIRKGHGAFRQAPLVDMLAEHGEKFTEGVERIRNRNRQMGVKLNDGPYIRFHRS
jgi:hypothetical protein